MGIWNAPRTLAALLFGLTFAAGTAVAGPIAVTNHGFEDTTGQTPFNEFTFGIPTGWTAYGPPAVLNDSDTYLGTLQPNGTEFFNTTAPEGDLVAILFNAGREGEGAYGLEQTLAATLQANTSYELTVEVGNIASGTAENGQFFNLDEFPGYLVQLLAGGVVIAEDDDGLVIPEGEFALSTVTFDTGAFHALLGQPLGIRLVNKNIIPAGFNQGNSPDLEVDFDDVQLTGTPNNLNPVPEPSTLCLFAVGACVLLLFGRKRFPGRCLSRGC